MKKTNKTDLKTLLELRQKIKSKQPHYVRQDVHKKKKIATNWRRPKGLHSKMRHCKRGYRTKLQVGYGAPRAVKGLHKSGLRPIIVTHQSQLKQLDRESQGIVLSSKLGVKKRLVLLKEAEQLKLTILNLDPQKYRQREEEKRKKEESPKTEKPEAEIKKADHKGEEATHEEKHLPEKERKEKERREQEKILTKKV